MVEIKKELKQENMSIKSNAIAKLLYVSCNREQHTLCIHPL